MTWSAIGAGAVPAPIGQSARRTGCGSDTERRAVARLPGAGGGRKVTRAEPIASRGSPARAGRVVVGKAAPVARPRGALRGERAWRNRVGASQAAQQRPEAGC